MYKKPKKKSKVFILITQVGVFISIVFIFLLIDSFTILTFFWEKHNAIVLEANTIEYPRPTRFQGTLISFITDARIEYEIDGKKYSRNIQINTRVISGQNIEIRVNHDNSKITAARLNFSLYFMLLFSIILYFFWLYYHVIKKYILK